MSGAVLDLFSAAAGGWSLGMHRAGFTTIAACENIDWRRTVYAQNNPGVPIYDDVCTLTAERLLRDIGKLPTVIVGSPPCQDISSANTKGKGVEGERSGLFFEAVRLIGECRPRWFALENSSNLRTRGADAVLAALEAIGYACWATVVRAGDIGANHERPRSWLIGCDLEQVTDPDRQLSDGRSEQPRLESEGRRLSGDGAADRNRFWSHGAWTVPGGHGGLGKTTHAGQAEWRPHLVQGGDRDGQEGEREEVSGRYAEYASSRDDNASHAGSGGQRQQSRRGCGPDGPDQALHEDHDPSVDARNTPDPDQAGQADGRMESGLRQEEITDDGCGDGWSSNRPGIGQVAIRPDDRSGADGPWPLWSLDDLAGRLRVDDGLPGRLAATRVAVGGPRGTSAASLIVEAYGDAVVPQIPEAIGRAILRTERALAAIHRRAA